MKRRCGECGGKRRAHYYVEHRCEDCGDVDYFPLCYRPTPSQQADLAASRARIAQLEAVVEAALRLASTDPDGATGSAAPDSLTPEYALVDANCWRALRAALDTPEICTAVAAMQTGRGEGNVPDTKEVQHG